MKHFYFSVTCYRSLLFCQGIKPWYHNIPPPSPLQTVFSFHIQKVNYLLYILFFYGNKESQRDLSQVTTVRVIVNDVKSNQNNINSPPDTTIQNKSQYSKRKKQVL